MSRRSVKDVSKASARSLVAPPNNFLFDTFTDTDALGIKSHVGETRHGWADFTTNGTQATIQANRFRPAANPNYYYATFQPPTSNYLVECTIDWLSTLASDNIGVIGRGVPGAGTESYYLARYTGAGTFGLFKVVNGSAAVQIGSSYSDAFTSGSRVLGLEMIGESISMLVDGVVRVSAQDNSIKEKGVCGVRAGAATGTTTGRQINSFRAYG